MKRLLKTSMVAWCLLAAGLAVTLSLPPSSADTLEENKPIGTAVQQERWLEGLSLVGSGKIDKAAGIINNLTAAGVSDERVAHVQSWLSDYGKLEASRRERIAKDYGKYISWAREDIAAGRRHQALVTI